MDHIVYVDAKENELQKIVSGKKRLIIRGATGRKLPYGRVNPGDRLFFMPNDGSGKVYASAEVSTVFNSEKLSEAESLALVEKNQAGLLLSPKQLNRWAGKRYLVLIGIGPVTALSPFAVDRSSFGSMDDWLPVDNIENVRQKEN